MDQTKPIEKKEFVINVVISGITQNDAALIFDNLKTLVVLARGQIGGGFWITTDDETGVDNGEKE